MGLKFGYLILSQTLTPLTRIRFSLKKMQNVILKNILGVHGKSSNLATRCELGHV